MARVLKHIRDHQAASGVCPENCSAIGRAVSLSHTHVRRLINQALSEGLLERKADGISSARVVVPAARAGGVRVPRTTIAWESPLRLDDDDAVWLDPQFFNIHPAFQHWLVGFREPEPPDHPTPWKLGPHLFAIVRQCPPRFDPHGETTWWLVEDERGCVHPLELIRPTEFYVKDSAYGRKGFTIKVDKAVQALRIVRLLECRDL